MRMVTLAEKPLALLLYNMCTFAEIVIIFEARARAMTPYLGRDDSSATPSLDVIRACIYEHPAKKARSNLNNRGIILFIMPVLTAT